MVQQQAPTRVDVDTYITPSSFDDALRVSSVVYKIMPLCRSACSLAAVRLLRAFQLLLDHAALE